MSWWDNALLAERKISRIVFLLSVTLSALLLRMESVFLFTLFLYERCNVQQQLIYFLFLDAIIDSAYTSLSVYQRKKLGM